MSRIFLSITCFLITSQLLGQSFQMRAIAKTNSWHQGMVTTNDGTVLHGLVRYNDLIGTLSIQTENSSESFGPNTVPMFEFTDNQTGKERRFVSLPYPRVEPSLTKDFLGWKQDFETNMRKGGKIYAFAEVLCEGKTFALLSKMSQVKAKEVTRSSSAGPYGGMVTTDSYTEYKQNEILFFFDHEGNLKPFLEIVFKQKDHGFWDSNSSSSKRVDKDLLEEMTGEYYSKLMEYAKAKNLKKNKKEDVVQLINYFISLSGS